MLNVIMLNVIMLNVIMLHVIMLNVILQNANMFNVIMLSVMAPFRSRLNGDNLFGKLAKCRGATSFSIFHLT